MKDRIKQFIDYKGISPGDLAVALDVQRSNISHILNGRNKPGASFIEKFLLVYPDLDARWLLTGTGSMITSENENLKDVKDVANEFTDKEEKVVQHDTSVTKTEINKSNTDTQQKRSTSTDAVSKVLLLYADGSFTSYDPK